MRFLAVVGAVALFAVASADQTGETEADNLDPGNVQVLTSIAVTTTVTESCSGGKCRRAAQTTPPSTRTTDALTVLSNALHTPTPSNALVILSEAQGSFAVPVVPISFSPELYSSYGLSGVGSVQSSQEGTAALTTDTAPPATYTPPADSSVISSIVSSGTTTPVIIPVPTTDTAATPATPATPSTLSTVPSGDSTANPVESSAASGTLTTTPTVAPLPPTSGVSSYDTAGSSVVSPVGGGSSTTVPAETTGGPDSTGGAGSTGSPSSTGGSGNPDASASQTGVTANPASGSETATGSGASQSAPVPTAGANLGINNQPAAFSGLVAAVGALLFI